MTGGGTPVLVAAFHGRDRCLAFVPEAGRPRSMTAGTVVLLELDEHGLRGVGAFVRTRVHEWLVWGTDGVCPPRCYQRAHGEGWRRWGDAEFALRAVTSAPTGGGQRSTVNGQRSTVNGQRSAVSGQRSAVIGQRSAVSSQQSTVNGQRSTVLRAVTSAPTGEGEGRGG
jgi:hypothetical protein